MFGLVFHECKHLTIEPKQDVYAHRYICAIISGFNMQGQRFYP